MRAWLVISLVLGAAGTARPAARPQEPPPDLVLELDDADAGALMVEIKRAQALSLPGAPPPYFVALVQSQEDNFTARAELGALLESGRHRVRVLSSEVRVGDMHVDSSGFVSGMDFFGSKLRQLPLQGDPLSLRWDAWQGIDTSYKHAVQVLNRKRGKLAEERDTEPVDDFSPAPAMVSEKRAQALPEPVRLSAAEWEERVRRISLALHLKRGPEGPGSNGGEQKGGHDIDRGVIGFAAGVERRTLITSEGTRVVLPRRLAELDMSVEVRAADGMQIRLSRHLFARAPAELPEEAQLIAMGRALSQEARTIAAAGPIETYDGPVLFEPEAAALLIQLFLGRHLGANRPFRTSFDHGGQADEGLMAGRLGRRVTSPLLTVVDDPTLAHLGKLGLLGGYVYDDEGVKGQRVPLISGGVLQDLLSSRRPSRDVRTSNGHGRAAFVSRWPQAAPSNLIVSSSLQLGPAALRARLFQDARAVRVKAPLLVRGVIIERRAGSEFPAVRLVSAVLLGADGKEQPVRGGELGWVSPRLLRNLLATGDAPLAHTMLVDEDGDPNANGFPITIVTPALLLGDVEVQRDRGPYPRPRLLPPP